MDLAERGSRLSNGLWVRELRKRSAHGHRTAILSTDYRSAAAPVAVAMFARWSQENFFKYAREHFALDRLADYRTEEISTEADLLPDPAAGTLTVRLHHSANAATDAVIEKLCEELNETATVFPRTNLRLVLKPGSTQIP